MRSLSAVAAIVVLLIACTGNGAEGDGASSTPEPTEGKYTQTWTVLYTDTTCPQWNDDMTAKQQWVMAGDMLYAAREGDGDSGLPADSLVDLFRASINDVCREDQIGIKVAEVAASLYVLSSDFRP